ncbi:uncharacterized protein zgc:174906 isoform X2 [Sardina pilchardus]|uniref:uncharacterized protein zgc:174906 isoform X2 n=1 Tax=Sardina pilchardus TaxID=27697 RepID=UPI002E0FA27F
MESGTVGGDVLLRKLKPRLIDILTADTDLLLQHTDSLELLTRQEYSHVKAITNPSEKARDLLDYVIQKGSSTSWDLIHLLQEKEMQETFPKLIFLKELTRNDKTIEMYLTENCGVKRKKAMDEEEPPSKQLCSNVVTEQQLMLVATNMGRSWKQFGRMALGISTTKLEQIVEDNPHNLVEQTFAMLRFWSMRERSKATAKRLHGLLSEGDWALPPESINFLLDDN